jgi:NitT/TauT family transport system permease protein
VTEARFVNEALFPGPLQVLLAFVEMAREGVLWSDLRASLYRVAVGFSIGAASGVVVGLLTGRITVFHLALNPILSVLRPIPAIALVPVAIVWFGIGDSSKFFVIAYTVFLAVWLNTHHGMTLVADTYVKAARSLGATRLREFVEIVIPAASPHIMAGLRLGAAVAFLSLVAAELTGASSGIGYRLQEARQFIRTDRMFVSLMELGVLGAALDYVFVLIGRRAIHWEQL